MPRKHKPEDFTRALREAVDSYDKTEATRLCDELLGHLRGLVDPYPVRSAKDILAILRKKRYFDLMARVSDGFLRTGLDEPQLRRQYAQALLDMGNVSAALDVLQRLSERTDISRLELAEVKGLLGRGYKQIYMDAHDPRPVQNQAALRKAISIYYDVYKSDRAHLWHAVNAVSLLGRAHRDGIQVTDLPDCQQLASELADMLEEMDRSGLTSMWDLATAAEAAVALRDYQAAGAWLKRYISSQQADAFELASTYRQFIDVIQLDQEENEEKYLLDLLRAALVKSEGGGLTIAAVEMAVRVATTSQAAEGLEKVLGDTSYLPHDWLLRGIRRACSVGRVWRKGAEQAVGTGFLLPGDLLRPEWAGRQVFLTNSHVVSQAPVQTGTLLPNQAAVSFDAAEGRAGELAPRHAVKSLRWESPIRELDTTMLELDVEIPSCDTYELASLLPQPGERLYVIGHPKGGGLSYSIQDNRVLAINDPPTRIHYRSPTDPGSSGSPLFNDQWEVLGIHHAGLDDMPRLDDPNKTYPANEGIPLKAIIGKLNSP
jgi:S1-C subfamily serine protease